MKDGGFSRCRDIWRNYIDCKKRDIEEIEEKIKKSNDLKEIESLTNLVNVLKETLPENEKLLEKMNKTGYMFDTKIGS